MANTDTTSYGPRWWKWVRWPVLIVVLLLVGGACWQSCSGEKEPPPLTPGSAESPIELKVDSANPYCRLDRFWGWGWSKVTTTLPPTGDEWSDWVVRPAGTHLHDKFLWNPHGQVDYRAKFVDGSTDTEYDFNPTKRRFYEKKLVQSVQFRNHTAEPVKIEFYLR